MPLVFAENEDTESGIHYMDLTGVQYQYPRRMYKNLIQPGERFVYYRGRKTKTGSRIPQVYFGIGIVGDVQDDPADNSRMICDILDYRRFGTPVPFKTGENYYLETGGKRKGYYQRGVRRVTEVEFENILSLAGDLEVSEKDLEVQLGVYDQYASPVKQRSLMRY